MGFAIFALLLAALSAEYARGLVIVKPQVIPSVIKHAVAAFGPQDIGDPEKCKKNKNDCFPATQGELVGIKKLESGSRDIIYCCDPDELPTELPKDDFIIVAMRDECEFSTKALVAQNAGAKGLIVYNSMFGEELEIMRQVDGPDILIPSIFITRESGDEILELIASDQEVVAVINATGSWSWEGDNWQLTVLWFLFVAFIAVSIYIFFPLQHTPALPLPPFFTFECVLECRRLFCIVRTCLTLSNHMHGVVFATK